MNNIFYFLKRVVKPLRAEFLFFFIVFALLVQQPIEWLFLAGTDRWWQVGKFLQGIAIETGIVYLATCIVYYTHSKVVKWILYLLNWALMSITLFLVMNFEMSISQQTLTVLVETTPKESSEFISTYMFNAADVLSYMIDAVVLLLIILLNRKEAKIRAMLRKFLNNNFTDYLVSVLIIVGTGFAVWAYLWLAISNNSSKVYKWRKQFSPDSIDIFTQSMQAINSIRAFDNDVKMAIIQAKKVYDTKASVTENDSLTVVYVLGESYIKHHASLYGYPLKTTPTLDAERDRGNLFAFNDVVAQENITSVVEKNTFSLNCIAEGESWFEAPNFTTIFKHSGYDVYMWDIQRDFMKNKLFTMTVNQYVYNPEIVKYSYTKSNTRILDYDAKLIDDFKRAVKFKNKHNLIVFHLFGQHVAPQNRYPKDSAWGKRFTADSIRRCEKWLSPENDKDKKKRQYIATYDNATCYNDYVLEKVFDMFRNKNAVVLYFSDHGEEVYDFRDAKGRHNETNPKQGTLMYEYEVPFMIWCSDTYKARHPQLIADIKASLNRPFMTDAVGYILLNLGQISTPYYKADRDLINPAYKARKRILNDRIDYDKVMKGVDRQKLKPQVKVRVK